MTTKIATVPEDLVDTILNKLLVIQDLTEQLYTNVKNNPNVETWQKDFVLSMLQSQISIEGNLIETLIWGKEEETD